MVLIHWVYDLMKAFWVLHLGKKDSISKDLGFDGKRDYISIV